MLYTRLKQGVFSYFKIPIVLTLVYLTNSALEPKLRYFFRLRLRKSELRLQLRVPLRIVLQNTLKIALTKKIKIEQIYKTSSATVILFLENFFKSVINRKKPEPEPQLVIRLRLQEEI